MKDVAGLTMLDRVQADIHYSFRENALLLLALTHSSHCNEVSGAAGHNERMEFLGDAVLELCVSRFLYDLFPELREGELTLLRSRLVSQSTLAALAVELKLDQALVMGRGEEEQGGRARSSMLCDVLEAVLGAVFLDGGFDEAERVVRKLLMPKLREASAGRRDKDDKSRLQEVTQKLFQDRPVYVLKGSLGPEHAKRFVVELALPDGKLFEAEGSSLKKAEQTAAGLALRALIPEL